MKAVVQELKSIQREYFPSSRSAGEAIRATIGGLGAHAAKGDEEEVECAQCFCSYNPSLCVRCPALRAKHTVCEECFRSWVRQQLTEEERYQFEAYGRQLVCPLCLPLQKPFTVER